MFCLIVGVTALTRTDYTHGQRDIESVGDPANVVGVLALTVGKVRRAPARDRFADELLGRHHHRECGKQRASVSPRQSFYKPVVISTSSVITPLGFLDAHQQPQYSVHRSSSFALSTATTHTYELSPTECRSTTPHRTVQRVA